MNHASDYGFSIAGQLPGSTEARSITVGSTTPWGIADHAEHHANGITFISTPSHGGFYVPPHLNEQIPAAWRAASFNKQGERGWYEEDCDWCMVVLAFPEIRDNDPAKGGMSAQEMFDHWIKPNL